MKPNKTFICMFVVILLGTLTLSVFANEKSNFTEIEDYIYNIYEKYQEKDYKAVYNNMHPEIRDILKKEKYIKFQEKNTEKYNIKISEVEVLEVTFLEELPEDFKEIISDKKNYEVYEISIKYKTNYKKAGSKKEKIIEKESYVASKNKQNYLLWNPNIINKD